MPLRDKLLVLAVLAAALLAAGRMAFRYVERRQARLDYGSVAALELRGSVLNASPEIGRAASLSVAGERLLVSARRSDSALYVVSTETGRLVGSMGAKGDGRGQFRAPATVVQPGDGSADSWLYDIALQRLTRLRPANALPAADTSASGVVQFPPDHIVTDVAWLEDGRIVASGFFAGGRFGVFDRRGAFVESVGALPPNPRGDSTEAFQAANASRARADPGLSMLAVGALYAGRLEIFDVQDWRARPADVPFPYEPEYAIEEGRRGPTFVPTRDTRAGYIDLAVTQRHIFALFSGRTEISHPKRDNYAEYVHLFDWEGRFVGAYHLDQDVFAIAFDPEERKLYAARHIPEPAILVYDLDNMP